MTNKTQQVVFDLILITTDDSQSTINQLEKLVSDKSGEIIKKESWGKKNFSYPIKKTSSGFYHSWQVSLPQNLVTSFKKQLDFTDNLLRYLFLKIDR